MVPGGPAKPTTYKTKSIPLSTPLYVSSFAKYWYESFKSNNVAETERPFTRPFSALEFNCFSQYTLAKETNDATVPKYDFSSVFSSTKETIDLASLNVIEVPVFSSVATHLL